MSDLPEGVALIEIDQPKAADLKQITNLARRQYRLLQEKARLEEELKKVNQQLMDVSERELPQVMTEAGVKKLSLANNVGLSIDEVVYANITEERANAAHDWLEKHGHADLITREFKIRFNREDEKWASKFQRDLEHRKRKLNVGLKRTVHAGRLKAWVREQLDAGIVIPEDLFGVYKKKVAVLDLPKEKVDD